MLGSHRRQMPCPRTPFRTQPQAGGDLACDFTRSGGGCQDVDVLQITRLFPGRRHGTLEHDNLPLVFARHRCDASQLRSCCETPLEILSGETVEDRMAQARRRETCLQGSRTLLGTEE
jgi:hypothetical protein